MSPGVASQELGLSARFLQPGKRGKSQNMFLLWFDTQNVRTASVLYTMVRVGRKLMILHGGRLILLSVMLV